MSDAPMNDDTPRRDSAQPEPDAITLHAYVDGELTASEAAEVAVWLKDHPVEAQRVLDWQAQRQQLQALRLDRLDEPLPADLEDRLRAAWARGQDGSPSIDRSQEAPPLPQGARPEARTVSTGPLPGWQRPAAHRFGAEDFWRLGGLAASVAVGALLGWILHGRLDPPGASMAQARPPAFVTDAGVAHALYTPERRHPVEVGAEQQEHLVQWLSRRLGQPLRIPHLGEQGWQLVGGRLLPASSPEAGHLARAQFMYESTAGERLTLYVSVLAEGRTHPSDPDTAFQFAGAGADDPQRQSFYWIDGRLGYALTGQADRARLAHLAEVVHRQLSPPGSAPR